MDNYNVIAQLNIIAQLLQKQNELLERMLQPQEDERTRARKILQDAIRRAEENKQFNLMDTSPSAAASDQTKQTKPLG